MIDDSVSVAIAIGAVVATGIIRTSIGVGAGVFLTASLSLLFDPRLALAVMAFLQLAFGASAVMHYWNRWDTPLVIRLSLFAVAGVFLGTWLVTSLSLVGIRRIIGSVLLVYVFLAATEPRGATHQNRGALPAVRGAATAFAAGAAGALANACGAVMAMYLRKRNLHQQAFLGTLSAIVLTHDVVRLGAYWQFGLLTVEALLFTVAFVPFAFLGGWLGARLARRVSAKILTKIVLIAVAGIGLALVL